MSPIGRLGPACTCGCGRPARELSDYSTACWMALSARARALIRWDQPTEPIDSLEVIYLLPTIDPERPAA